MEIEGKGDYTNDGMDGENGWNETEEVEGIDNGQRTRMEVCLYRDRDSRIEGFGVEGR